MSSQPYRAQDIVELLHQQTVATLPEIKAVLGTTSGDTAHRKLAAVGGRTSYSHRGRYYTLNELTDYDEHGLWFYGDIHFSAHGTLLKTGEHIIDRSASGYFEDEFSRLVKLDACHSLPQLVNAGLLTRERMMGATYTAQVMGKSASNN